MESSMRQLILGGAQFGDSYGKFIQITKLLPENLETLLRYSFETGISQIDLALNYANADKNLAGTRMAQSFSYSTKFSYKMGLEDEIVKLLVSQRKLIGIESFSVIFIHNWFELSNLDQKGAISLLNNLVNMGLTKKAGISVYSVHEIEDFDSGINVIQAPLSFINRQFLNSGRAMELKSGGVEFQARSIFHQGLLLNPSQRIYEKFPEIEGFFKYCATNNLKILQAALSVFDNQDLFSSLLVGAAGIDQLKEIVDTPILISNILEETSNLNFSTGFSDPRTW
jgi:aryl-alcohol dehydrogenase-like predicted oxidoreductase